MSYLWRLVSFRAPCKERSRCRQAASSCALCKRPVLRASWNSFRTQRSASVCSLSSSASRSFRSSGSACRKCHHLQEMLLSISYCLHLHLHHHIMILTPPSWCMHCCNLQLAVLFGAFPRKDCHHIEAGGSKN